MQESLYEKTVEEDKRQLAQEIDFLLGSFVSIDSSRNVQTSLSTLDLFSSSIDF